MMPAIESVKNSFRLRGAEVFHTAEDGCIRVEIAPAGLPTQSFRPHVRAIAGRAGGRKSSARRNKPVTARRQIRQNSAIAAAEMLEFASADLL